MTTRNAPRKATARTSAAKLEAARLAEGQAPAPAAAEPGGPLDLDAYAAARGWDGKPVTLGGRTWLMRGAMHLDDAEQYDRHLMAQKYQDALAMLLVDQDEAEAFVAEWRQPIRATDARALFVTVFDYLTGSTEGEGEAPARS